MKEKSIEELKKNLLFSAIILSVFQTKAISEYIKELLRNVKVDVESSASKAKAEVIIVNMIEI